MRTFLLNIIRCDDCEKDNLLLTVDRAVKYEDDGEVDYAKIKSRISHNQNFIEAFNAENISGEYFSTAQGDSEDAVLFNNDIIEGVIRCDDCDKKFKIYDGIVDMLN